MVRVALQGKARGRYPSGHRRWSGRPNSYSSLEQSTTFFPPSPAPSRTSCATPPSRAPSLRLQRETMRACFQPPAWRMAARSCAAPTRRRGSKRPRQPPAGRAAVLSAPLPHRQSAPGQPGDGGRDVDRGGGQALTTGIGGKAPVPRGERLDGGDALAAGVGGRYVRTGPGSPARSSWRSQSRRLLGRSTAGDEVGCLSDANRHAARRAPATLRHPAGIPKRPPSRRRVRPCLARARPPPGRPQSHGGSGRAHRRAHRQRGAPLPRFR